MNEDPAVRAILERDHDFRHRLLDSSARARAVVINMRQQIEDLLAGNDDPGDLLNRTPTLIYLLRSGASIRDAVPYDEYAKFAHVVVQAFANQGIGSEYGRHDLVVDSIDVAIERVRAAGKDPVELLIAKAQYLSYAQNESPRRLATLREAEKIAAGENLLRVYYQLTWYLIDASRYGKAVRLCDQGIEHARAINDKWVIGFVVNRGIARYTTLNNPTAARADFDQAINLAEPATDDQDISRFLADALHYLGRCDLDDGHVEEALRHYVAGRKYKARIPFESRAIAYYHIRMAEVLTGVGNFYEARDHMDGARAYLDRTGDTGAASVSYDYALANMHMAQADGESALSILEKCVKDAKSCRYSRGRILALTRIFAINCQLGNYLRAVLTLFRGVPLLFNGELRRNNIVDILVRIRRYVLHVFHPYRSATTSKETLACPCSMHAS